MKKFIAIVMLSLTSIVFSQENSDLLLENACRKAIVSFETKYADSIITPEKAEKIKKGEISRIKIFGVFCNPLSDSVYFAKYKDILRQEILSVYKEYRRNLGLNTNITLSDNLNKACSLNSVKVQNHFKQNNLKSYTELKHDINNDEHLYLSHSEIEERLRMSDKDIYNIGENVAWWSLKLFRATNTFSKYTGLLEKEINIYIKENDIRKIAEFLIDGWDKSPGHHENLILPNMKSVGFDLDFILDKKLENESFPEIIATMMYETN